MRALVWHGKEDVRCDNVSDPKIEHPRDAIIKITSTCVCGSDLHLYAKVGVVSLRHGRIASRAGVDKTVEGTTVIPLAIGSR